MRKGIHVAPGAARLAIALLVLLALAAAVKETPAMRRRRTSAAT
ncbi:hypothetical protein [Actinomadura latina]|nr:hypothetical protein [Actinomadura latina]